MSSKPRAPRGEGSFAQRSSDGLWFYSYELGKTPEGKRRRRTIYAGTKAALKKKLFDLRAAGGGTLQGVTSGTVADWMTTWLAEQKSALNPNTYVGYEGAWRLHAESIIGSRPMARFDVEDVEQLYAALRAKGTSASVIGRVATVLHRAFQVAIRRRRYRRANPFALVDRPRVRKAETRVLNPEEARRFIAAATGDRYEALWVLLITAGLRLGEALALEWGDLDFTNRTLAIQRSLLEVGGRFEIGTTKSRSSRRRVILGQLAVTALRTRKRFADREDHGSKLIFPTTIGTQVRRSNLRRSHFIPVCRAAKLKGLRIHDLRHTMATLSLVQGVAAKVVAERLGHSRVGLTLDRYSHVVGELQQDAAKAIDRALAPSRAKK